MVNAGPKIALVGPSGNGKSTVIASLQRFYDPASGVVSIDGVDIKQVDVNVLRGAIGYVGQEPVLFDASFGSNVVYGNRNAKPEDLERVKLPAKLDFVARDNVQWDTVLGP